MNNVFIIIVSLKVHQTSEKLEKRKNGQVRPQMFFVIYI